VDGRSHRCDFGKIVDVDFDELRVRVLLCQVSEDGRDRLAWPAPGWRVRDGVNQGERCTATVIGQAQRHAGGDVLNRTGRVFTIQPKNKELYNDPWQWHWRP
jgi:hypothetical protein